MYSMKRYWLSHRRNAEIAEHAESFSKMFICGLCGLPPPLDAYSSSFGEARRLMGRFPAVAAVLQARDDKIAND